MQLLIILLSVIFILSSYAVSLFSFLLVSTLASFLEAEMQSYREIMYQLQTPRLPKVSVCYQMLTVSKMCGTTS